MQVNCFADIFVSTSSGGIFSVAKKLTWLSAICFLVHAEKGPAFVNH